MRILDKFIIYQDASSDVDTSLLARGLSQVCNTVKFLLGSNGVQVPKLVNAMKIPGLIRSQLDIQRGDRMCHFIITDHPFDNNWFFVYQDGICIASTHGWDQLTTLSKINGVAYFVANLMALHLDDSFRHDQTTGCIYDFLWDKAGIDLCMRTSFICPSCLERILRKSADNNRFKMLQDIKHLLNAVSSASKWNEDFGSVSTTTNKVGAEYDVFLCHNSDDKPIIRKKSEHLSSIGIIPWLDKINCAPDCHGNELLRSRLVRLSPLLFLLAKMGMVLGNRWRLKLC